MLLLVALACPQPAAPAPLVRYDAREIEGFRVLVHPEADADPMRHRRVLAALTFDLEVIASRVPPDALEVLRTIPVVVTTVSPERTGFSGRGMCFHPSAGWLDANGFDAAREGTIEVLNMSDFLEWRAEQPMMLLHEFAHAFHWKSGFERADVAHAFARARDEGRYERVAHALAPPDERRAAYAITNEREYFAELSEALFGRNDFEPFTREDLRAFDPAGFEVVVRAWGVRAEEGAGGLDP